LGPDRLNRRWQIAIAADEFLDAYGDAIPRRPIWIRSIMREPGEGGWVIWQYHPAGRVAGIEGDVNVLSGPLDQLINP
jgi:lysozyme